MKDSLFMSLELQIWYCGMYHEMQVGSRTHSGLPWGCLEFPLCVQESGLTAVRTVLASLCHDRQAEGICFYKHNKEVRVLSSPKPWLLCQSISTVIDAIREDSEVKDSEITRNRPHIPRKFREYWLKNLCCARARMWQWSFETWWKSKPGICNEWLE